MGVPFEVALRSRAPERFRFFLLGAIRIADILKVEIGQPRQFAARVFAPAPFPKRFNDPIEQRADALRRAEDIVAGRLGGNRARVRGNRVRGHGDLP